MKWTVTLKASDSRKQDVENSITKARRSALAVKTEHYIPLWPFSQLMLISNFRNGFTTTTKYSCMMRVKDSRLKHCGQKNLDFLTPDVAIFVPDSISEKFQLMQCTSIFLCDIKRWDNFCKQNTENNQTSCIHTQTKARHGTNPVFLRLYSRSQCRGLKATAGGLQTNRCSWPLNL